MPEEPLEPRLAAVLGAEEVRDLTRLSGGASRETYRFVATIDGHDRALVLQRRRPGSDRDMPLEAAVLQAARAGGVRVAEVVATSGTDDDLGAPYLVLTAVEGETIARKILRDPEFAVARERLAGQLGEACARLHAVDPTTVPGLVVLDQLAYYRQALDLLDHPHPAFELAFRWLERNPPPERPTVVVHGDIRLGNVIVDDQGLAAVIDWELAHLGQPGEDLGWICARAWRFGGSQPVAGVGAYEDLLGAYAAAGGAELSVDELRWWETLSSLKWGIMCGGQARTHLTGLVRSHELAAIGRRQCENEYDLFLLLP